MTVFIKGVRIKLNDKQIAEVDKELKSRERCRISFVKMLRKFGFRNEDKAFPNSFGNKTFDWYAEIIDRGNYSDVWMVGKELKSSGGFPGGWIYSEPKEIEDEIVRALDLKN